MQAPATVPSNAESPAGGMVLCIAASAGKLPDLPAPGGFLQVPEYHKRIQGETCCAVFAFIMFCLAAVLIPDTVHSASAS